MTNQPERINKVLAKLGYGSRREIDTLITEGKVQVNSQAAKLGQKITTQDVITINNQPVIATQNNQKIVLAFYKPGGVTTTRRDPFAKMTIMDFMPTEYHHLFPVGRLDRMSRGLLLLTNDGDLAERLSHPRYGHEKEYEVTIQSHKPVTLNDFKAAIQHLSHTILDPSLQTKPVTICEAQFDSHTQQGKVTLILKEGKKRQIRQLFAILGYEVRDLLRTRINRITLAGLKEGQFVKIDPKLVG